MRHYVNNDEWFFNKFENYWKSVKGLKIKKDYTGSERYFGTDLNGDLGELYPDGLTYKNSSFKKDPHGEFKFFNDYYVFKNNENYEETDKVVNKPFSALRENYERDWKNDLIQGSINQEKNFKEWMKNNPEHPYSIYRQLEEFITDFEKDVENHLKPIREAKSKQKFKKDVENHSIKWIKNHYPLYLDTLSKDKYNELIDIHRNNGLTQYDDENGLEGEQFVTFLN